MARKSAARPCAESEGPEIFPHDGKERPRTKLPLAQTAPLGRGSRTLHPSEVLRFCSSRANSYRATWLMRASLAVALREYNDRATRWKIHSTIFTKPNDGVIMPAVVVRFHPSLLQKFICAVVATPLLCVQAENAAHQKSPEASPSAGTFDAHAAERFAKLALQCVHKEYPNKISHVLNSDADVAPPCKLTPAFCGCYDWHSSVHGHWLLVRLLRTFPDAPFAKAARDALKESLTAENLRVEAAYLQGEGRASFKRPYGLAWLLQLCAELREWDDPQAQEMLANLKPLEDAAVERLRTWLPKLSHPVRIG